MSVVSADITISGKLFHTGLVYNAKVSKYKMQKYSSAKVDAKACVKGERR